MGEAGASAIRERLAELLYPCFCSRGDIAARVAREEAKSGTQWPRDPDGAPLYPGTCRELTRLEVGRRIAAGETPAWRLDVAKAMRSLTGALAYRRFDPAGGDDWVAADPARWGDVIVARKEVPTSYHLSVVVDDALQGSRMWCAGATWRPPPTSTCFCRRCFGCRARPIIITGWSPTMPASSLPRAPDRRVSGS
jgi:hypothetical protein